jgi:hypothetical protein
MPSIIDLRREIAAQAVLSDLLILSFMTKEELIALARKGKAQITMLDHITRYCITETDLDAEGHRVDYPAIFLSISRDGTVYDDDAYFTDGVIVNEDQVLTDEDLELLAETITDRREEDQQPKP